mmetsp:Transcript_6724/g.18809  ORF Transcript_6724/g.18809 Transcript_6724/m.18809 type:complete len:1043 (-) Transcript_6724:248-3376(-)|eukprot:CAMPEP_0117664084 /NCGR_PEP_ID=MMETSP0804-20121206/9001_1 /TAXON_ID=1074897 /ORGANISM="Tetraselmis astigmatica, Strain CCMP880" /LENGTH=1042 /DNA_ID=CAMNT_0005471233 /DNA_START=713 /DNA_END=3841 /DNA_ORIENTATION=+
MAEEYVMLRSSLDVLVQDYGSVLCELLDVIPGHTPSSPGQEIVDKNLSHFLDSYYLLKGRLQEQALSVALLAQTKSGKSTFFNAFLGDDCMPTGTVPETARICRIIHDPLIDEPVMKERGVVYQGTAQVRQRLHELNTEVRQREHCILDEEMVTIRAPLVALANQPPMPTELHLIDTPGPNEAGEEGLKYQVERLLDGVGVVVYLLDCTKLKTQEEKQMFLRLQQINPQLLQRLSKRLFFLVNKKDALMCMTDDDVRSYVAEIVTSQIGNGEFQLDPSQVLLISAKTGLYSRMIMLDRATAEHRNEFAKIAFGMAGWRKATLPQMKEAAPSLFEDSGISEVEDRLLKFLYSFAGRLQMLGSLDDISRHLSRVINSVSASHAALAHDYDTLSAKVAGMTHQLECVKQRFREVQSMTDTMEADVTDEITERMQKLKERLFEQLEAVLCETQSMNLQPRWKLIWSKIRDILPQTQQPHSSENSVQNILLDLYLSIKSQIDEEVAAFWRDLEESTNLRQHELFGVVNTKLQELAKEVEGVVSEKLDVVLQPANISMSPPSNDQYHEDLKRLFSEGISRQSETRDIEYTIENTVIEKHYHVPLCKLGEYYVARPVQSTEVKQVVDTFVSVDTDKVKDIFISHVDDTVSSSIKNVRTMVRRYIREHLDNANVRLDNYCASYTAEMAAALQEDVRGEEDRQRALLQAAHNLAAMKAIEERVKLLTLEVEGAHSDEEGDFVEREECEEMQLPEAPASKEAVAFRVPPVALEDSFMSVCNDPDEESPDSLPEVPTHAVKQASLADAEDAASETQPSPADTSAAEQQPTTEAAVADEPADPENSKGSEVLAGTDAPAVNPEGFEDFIGTDASAASTEGFEVFVGPNAKGFNPETTVPNGNSLASSVSGLDDTEEAADVTVDPDVVTYPQLPTGEGTLLEVAYPQVERMEPLSSPVEYPEVQPVHTTASIEPIAGAHREDSLTDQSDDSAAITAADVEIQMQPLPISVPGGSEQSNLAGSSSGPFNYEEAFHDCMSVREDSSNPEVEEDWVLA